MRVNGANTETFSPLTRLSCGPDISHGPRALGIKKRFSDPFDSWRARGRDRDAINLLAALLIDQVQSCHGATTRLAENHAIDDANHWGATTRIGNRKISRQLASRIRTKKWRFSLTRSEIAGGSWIAIQEDEQEWLDPYAANKKFRVTH